MLRVTILIKYIHFSEIYIFCWSVRTILKIPEVIRTKNPKVGLYLRKFSNETFKSNVKIRQSFEKAGSINQRGQVIHYPAYTDE